MTGRLEAEANLRLGEIGPVTQHESEIRMLGLPLEESRWFIRQLRPYLREHAFALLLATSSSLLLLTDALVVRWLIDVGLAKKDLRACLVACFALFLALALRGILSGAANFLTGRSYQNFAIDLRMKLTRHLGELAPRHHERGGSSSSVYLFQTSIHEVGTIGGEVIPNLLRTILVAICVAAIFIYLNRSMALLVLPLVPLYALSHRVNKQAIRDAYSQVDETQRTMGHVVDDQMDGIVQLQILSRLGWQKRELHGAMAKFYRAQVRRLRAERRFEGLNAFITAVGTALVLGFGSWEVLRGQLTIGGLFACYAYLLRLLDPLARITDMQSNLQRTATSIHRLYEAFHWDDRLETREAQCGTCPPDAVLCCQEVKYAYSAEQGTLRDISLSVASGSSLAIAGPSGAGKSTLAKLLARIYDADSGFVGFSGKDIRAIELKSIRREIIYVPHRPAIFTGTVKENLVLGQDGISHKEIYWAAAVTGLDKTVQGWPSGWAQKVGSGGAFLSGGERQRIEIARAILRRPKVLILDEATANLDVLSEAHIVQALRRDLPSMTLIVISHRLSSLSWVDQMVFMSAGRIEDSGSPGELYSRCRPYKEMFDLARDDLRVVSTPPGRRQTELEREYHV